MRKKVFAIFCALMCINASNADYSMSLQGGTFYGPGKMPDVAMPDGHIAVIQLKHNLIGETPFANNGSKPPNIRSGAHSEIWSAGLLSDGIQFNENMDGGIIDVGDGALKLLSVVTRDGALKGLQTYQLDSECNWQIATDLALDPGFAPGIIFARGLVITTGVVLTPHSLQSKMGMPGGIDSAGSLPSGTPVLGRLGDYDFDGTLDGTIVGAARIPLEHIFYPGAAVVQSRNFTSDIPISSFDAATLGLLSLVSYRQIFERIVMNGMASTLTVAYLKSNVKFYLEDIRLRLRAASRHLLSDTGDKIKKPSNLLADVNELSRSVDDLIASVESPALSETDVAISGIGRLLEKVALLADQMKPRLSYSCP